VRRVVFFIIGGVVGFLFSIFVKSRFHLEWDIDMLFPTFLFAFCTAALEKNY
tara:strand:- start:593 stop:748 length:156 start_codon:yes stop_codon:yes gene_type:complete